MDYFNLPYVKAYVDGTFYNNKWAGGYVVYDPHGVILYQDCGVGIDDPELNSMRNISGEMSAAMHAASWIDTHVGRGVIVHDYTGLSNYQIAILKGQSTNAQSYLVYFATGTESETENSGTLEGEIPCEEGEEVCGTYISTPICSDEEEESSSDIVAPEDIKKCILDNTDDVGNSYKLDSKFGGLDKNDYCDYRFKLNGNPINCDIQREITSTSDAYKIEYNENVKNYFKTIGKWGQHTKSHYYYFNLTSTSSVNILAKKDVIGSCSISLLDADERKIGSEMYFNQDNQINKTFTLNPGIYYLRVERESVLGSIYSIQIK